MEILVIVRTSLSHHYCYHHHHHHHHHHPASGFEDMGLIPQHSLPVSNNERSAY